MWGECGLGKGEIKIDDVEIIFSCRVYFRVA